jgi:hypothetical protein
MISFLCSAVLLSLFEMTGSFEEIKPIQKWDGRLKDPELIRFAPDNRLITELEQWKKIWQAWRPHKKLPDISFRKDIVLVATVDGPNRIMLGILKIENGELNYVVGSTRMAGPGFGYLLVQVPRAEIETVNHFPVPDPEFTHPPRESIKVDIVGRISTDVVAIGGETMGFVISANGIEWEIDLRDNPSLHRMAKRLSDSSVRVTGELTRTQGVEIGERWIVLVDSITEAGYLPPENEPSKNDGFSKIEIFTTGGLAGVEIGQTILPDGRVETVTSRQRITETWNLPSHHLAKLHRLVKSTDWSDLPAKAKQPQGADDFQYDVTMITSGKTFRFQWMDLLLKNIARSRKY